MVFTMVDGGSGGGGAAEIGGVQLTHFVGCLSDRETEMKKCEKERCKCTTGKSKERCSRGRVYVTGSGVF